MYPAMWKKIETDLRYMCGTVWGLVFLYVSNLPNSTAPISQIGLKFFFT
jgi:hypothetical protein